MSCLFEGSFLRCQKFERVRKHYHLALLTSVVTLHTTDKEIKSPDASLVISVKFQTTIDVATCRVANFHIHG